MEADAMVWSPREEGTAVSSTELGRIWGGGVGSRTPAMRFEVAMTNGVSSAV